MIVGVRCRLVSVRPTLRVHNVCVFVNRCGNGQQTNAQTENVGVGPHSVFLLPFGTATETCRCVHVYINTPQLQLMITKTV